MIHRVFIAFILSAIATVALFIGAGMMDGMCHCMKSMFSVFPYGSFVMMHFSSDTWGMLLTLIQFPAYALMVTILKGTRWRIGVALLLIVLHVAAASFALPDYCQSRRTCLLRNDHINVGMALLKECGTSNSCGTINIPLLKGVGSTPQITIEEQ